MTRENGGVPTIVCVLPAGLLLLSNGLPVESRISTKDSRLNTSLMSSCTVAPPKLGSATGNDATCGETSGFGAAVRVGEPLSLRLRPRPPNKAPARARARRRQTHKSTALAAQLLAEAWESRLKAAEARSRAA